MDCRKFTTSLTHTVKNPWHKLRGVLDSSNKTIFFSIGIEDCIAIHREFFSVIPFRRSLSKGYCPNDIRRRQDSPPYCESNIRLTGVKVPILFSRHVSLPSLRGVFRGQHDILFRCAEPTGWERRIRFTSADSIV